MWITRGKNNTSDCSNGTRQFAQSRCEKNNGKDSSYSMASRNEHGSLNDFKLQFCVPNFSISNDGKPTLDQGLSADESSYAFGQTEWTRVWANKVFPRTKQQLDKKPLQTEKKTVVLSSYSTLSTVPAGSCGASSLGKDYSTLSSQVTLRENSGKVPVRRIHVTREVISRVPISRVPITKRLGWGKTGNESTNAANLARFSGNSRALDTLGRDTFNSDYKYGKSLLGTTEPANSFQNAHSLQKNNSFQSEAISIRTSSSDTSSGRRSESKQEIPSLFCDGQNDLEERRFRRKMRFGSNNDIRASAGGRGEASKTISPVSLKGQPSSRDIFLKESSSQSVKKLNGFTGHKKTSTMIQLSKGGNRPSLFSQRNDDEDGYAMKGYPWQTDPIIIDGTSVAYTYGENFYFDWEGVHLSAQFFIENGCENITIVVPEEKLEPGMGKNGHYVEQLRKNNNLTLSTCWTNNNYKQLIYKAANKNQAVVISNDIWEDRDNTSSDIKHLTDKVFGFRFNTNSSTSKFVIFTSPFKSSVTG